MILLIKARRFGLCFVTRRLVACSCVLHTNRVLSQLRGARENCFTLDRTENKSWVGRKVMFPLVWKIQCGLGTFLQTGNKRNLLGIAKNNPTQVFQSSLFELGYTSDCANKFRKNLFPLWSVLRPDDKNYQTEYLSDEGQPAKQWGPDTSASAEIPQYQSWRLYCAHQLWAILSQSVIPVNETATPSMQFFLPHLPVPALGKFRGRHWLGGGDETRPMCPLVLKNSVSK